MALHTRLRAQNCFSHQLRNTMNTREEHGTSASRPRMLAGDFGETSAEYAGIRGTARICARRVLLHAVYFLMIYTA